MKKNEDANHQSNDEQLNKRSERFFQFGCALLSINWHMYLCECTISLGANFLAIKSSLDDHPKLLLEGTFSRCRGWIKSTDEPTLPSIVAKYQLFWFSREAVGISSIRMFTLLSMINLWLITYKMLYSYEVKFLSTLMFPSSKPSGNLERLQEFTRKAFNRNIALD
jgi:hypothetical protein